MSHLLVAVFDSPDPAQLAFDALRREGLHEDSLRIGRPFAAQDETSQREALRAAAQRSGRTRAALGEAVESMFVGPGQSSATVRPPRPTLHRGSVVLSARVETTEQARRATQVLQQRGAVDLEERAQD